MVGYSKCKENEIVTMDSATVVESYEPMLGAESGDKQGFNSTNDRRNASRAIAITPKQEQTSQRFGISRKDLTTKTFLLLKNLK